MTKIKVLFCPDFGGDVGYGHLTRSHALAEEFVKHGHDVAFIFKLGIDVPEQLKDSFKLYLVNELESPEEINKIIEESLFNVLVIDSYKWLCQSQYFQLSKKCVKVLFDDFCHPLPADIIINACPDASYNNQQDSESIYLLGNKFQILKKDLLAMSAPIFQPCVNKLSVLMGGSDPLNMVEKWISFFEGFFKEYGEIFKVNIFCGYFVKIPNNFESQSIKIQKTPPDFFSQVSQSQLAISAGGQTLYELIRLGIPTLGYEVGVDQKNNLMALSNRKLIINIGSPLDSNFYEAVKKTILSFTSDNCARQEMSRRQLLFLDHLGGYRIVKNVEAYYKLKQSIFKI